MMVGLACVGLWQSGSVAYTDPREARAHYRAPLFSQACIVSPITVAGTVN